MSAGREGTAVRVAKPSSVIAIEDGRPQSSLALGDADNATTTL
jgi:hypothetical protein